MPLDEAYFVWLYGQVGSVTNRNRAKTYWTLLRQLYQKPFAWSIEKDENRAHDGRDLRLEFQRETNTPINEVGWFELECSVLELLIALARKLADQGGGETSEWFWDMIMNLGLIESTDAYPFHPEIIDDIVNAMIEREYEPDGRGGLFPLQAPNGDQRGVEIWYQAEAYLLERF